MRSVLVSSALSTDRIECNLCACGHQEADLAAAPLTVTFNRAKVVDFTKAFMISDVSGLMKTRHATQLGIRSVRDLARQSVVKYGVVDEGTTEDFFRLSIQPDYQRMWAEMAMRDDSWVSTVEEGIERVLSASDEQPWAFLTESSALIASQTCDTTIVYSEVWRTLALALPRGSPYKDRLDLAMLETREYGHLEVIRTKWFQSPECDHSANGADKRFLFPPQ